MQLVTVDEVTASFQSNQFQLMDTIHAIIDQQIADAGMSKMCRISSMQTGQHYNPLWCDIGYEQIVDYSVDIVFQYGEQTYQYTFRRTVKLTTIK